MDNVHNPFLETFRIPIKPSKKIHIYLILIHIISLFLPWLSALNVFYKCVFTTVPLISAGYYLYKIKFSDKSTLVTELILNSDDDWQVKLNNDESYPAVIGPIVFVHPCFIVIGLIYNQTRQNFIFTVDNIDADLFRRLRVRLRFKAS